MLSTDVAAAPAASSIQDGAPFVGASRRDSEQPPDDFAAMFDRCAVEAAPASTATRPPRALPKGVGLQPEQAASTLVAPATSLSISEDDETATAVDADETIDAGVDSADDAGTTADPGAPAFDPRFFAPVPMPVPPASPTQPDTSAGTAEPGLAGHGRLGLPLHSRGPGSALTGATPRSMGPTTAATQRLSIDEASNDPTMPVELDAVAADGFDPAAAGLSTVDTTLTPEQRIAVQDAVERLAGGSPSVTTQFTPQADVARASSAPDTSSAPIESDARRAALSSLRAALAASEGGSQSPVTEATQDSPAVLPVDVAPAAETSPVVANSDALSRGLAQAVGATPQQAMKGLHRAPAHAPASAVTPVALQVADAEIADVRPGTTEGPETARTADVPVTVSADRGASESLAVQAAQVAPGGATGPTAIEGPPTASRARGNGARQDVQDAPAATPRLSARVTHAIAAFQAAAHAAGTPPAAQALATAATTPSAVLDSDLPMQIVQAIRVQFDNGSGEARVRLNPGFLGGMTVGVQVEGSSVVASLQASSAEVREWLQRNEQVLRQALADQGLQLDRLVIVEEEAKPGADDEMGNRSSQQQERQPQRRPRRPADEGTFEVEI